MTEPSYHRWRGPPMRTLLVAAAVVAPGLGADAAAQRVPEVNPRGADPPAPTPTPTPTPSRAPDPVIITIGPDGKPIQDAAPSDDPGAGRYHHDSGGRYPTYDDEPVALYAGPTPELHVVRRGDTLWDICWYYFNDPWQWPKVWSYNAQITNPHWIYPGDLVRLLPRGMIADAAGRPLPDEVEASGGGDAPTRSGPGSAAGGFEPVPARRYEVELRQVAFLDKGDIDDSIVVDGAIEAKELLSTGDGVYLRYPSGKPPKVGKRYSIYEADHQVTHPRGGKVVGSYVRLLGELEVTSVKKGKRARAKITSANREIERGALVGPVKKQLRTVPPTRSEVDLQGTIVAMLTSDQIMGTGEVVFIDLGKKSGLAVGNELFVVRRGDAYDDVMGPSSDVGQDDRRFPARALGRVMIVDVGDTLSIGLITLAVQEMGIGDLVMMQRAH
jgi:hypothetical protein